MRQIEQQHASRSHCMSDCHSSSSSASISSSSFTAPLLTRPATQRKDNLTIFSFALSGCRFYPSSSRRKHDFRYDSTSLTPITLCWLLVALILPFVIFLPMTDQCISHPLWFGGTTDTHTHFRFTARLRSDGRSYYLDTTVTW